MLLEYSFQNFSSFQDSVNFSLISTEDEKIDFPFNYVAGKTDILKSAVIVGENAGGKTNFVKSLSYLKSLFKETDSIKTNLKFINDHYNKGQDTRICDTTQHFSISVLIDDTVYYYELELDYLGIKTENFSMREVNQDKILKIFEVSRQEKYISSTDSIKMTTFANLADESHIPTLMYTLRKDFRFKDHELKAMSETIEEEHNGLYLTQSAILGVKPAVIFSRWINENLFVNISTDKIQLF